MLNNVNICYNLTVEENITLTLRGHDFTNEGGGSFRKYDRVHSFLWAHGLSVWFKAFAKHKKTANFSDVVGAEMAI